MIATNGAGRETHLQSVNGRVPLVLVRQSQMISATKSGNSVSFIYDGLGRCVKRTINNVATIIAYDGWKPLVDYDGSGNLLAANIYGPGADEILTRWVSALNTHLRYHHDVHGNVTWVLNDAGEAVERYTYDAFGKPKIMDWYGNERTQSAIGNRFLFQEREWIPELGIYDYRHRMYMPGLGRFLQMDPAGFDAGDMNLFRYCADDPVDRSDPEGLDYGPFASDDQAYRFFDAKFNNRSIAENKEYRAEIYQGTSTGRFYLTEARQGTERQTAPVGIKVNHSKYIGPAHTHGDWSRGFVDRNGVQHVTGRAKERRLDDFESSKPSRTDRNLAQDRSVYTSTPARDGWRQRPGEANPERIPTRDSSDPKPSAFKPITPETVEQWERKPPNSKN